MFMCYFSHMKQEFENVKIKKQTVDLLRRMKEVTGVPIATFVNTAVLEKIHVANQKHIPSINGK